ncbi:MAG: hypothetical protein PGN34_07645 [Methylobacterium frigidaeris]
MLHQRVRTDFPTEISPDFEALIEADRRFFRRFPHRTYRIRRMARCEVAHFEALNGRLAPMPADTAGFTVVKQIAPGVRLRVYTPGPADQDGSDLSDDFGAWLWQRSMEVQPHLASLEAGMRNAIARVGCRVLQ